jgi:hypothetical protein
MTRSFLLLTLCIVVASSFGCSSAKPQPAKAPAPVPTQRTGTLEITAGIHVIASVPLPRGFAPLGGYPPQWLESGSEVGLIGAYNGRLVMLGYSGPGWRTGRVIAAETGEAAAEPGRIMDLATSPDGMTLAIAVAVAGKDRLDIVLRDLIAAGPGHPMATFDGLYDIASVSWLNNSSVAIALRPSAKQPEIVPAAPADSGATPPPAQPTTGLQILVVAGTGSVAPMKLPCSIGALSWSPLGVYAVSVGGPGLAPALIDRRHSTCAPLRANAPVRVLGWDPVNERSFLYVQPIPASKSVGVYEHNIGTGRDKIIAVSSAAAAYTGGGVVIALGNQNLTFKAIAATPFLPVTAQLALFDPNQPEISIKQLGFQTVPPMLAASSMTYAKATDRVAIETYQPSARVALRKIITYTMHADDAFQIAYGPARGVAEMSWSPKGQWLAIADGDASGAALTIIEPPE